MPQFQEFLKSQAGFESNSEYLVTLPKLRRRIFKPKVAKLSIVISYLFIFRVDPFR